MTSDRVSSPAEAEPLPELTNEQRARREAENGVRQYDRMLEAINAGLNAQRFKLRVSALQSLNREAVMGLQISAGHPRTVPIM